MMTLLKTIAPMITALDGGEDGGDGGSRRCISTVYCLRVFGRDARTAM